MGPQDNEAARRGSESEDEGRNDLPLSELILADELSLGYSSRTY